MIAPTHTPEVPDADELGLGVGEGADVVGRDDGEPDRRARADLLRLRFAEPCSCGMGLRLGEAVRPVLAAMKSGALSRNLT